jgi:hypothetical protein
MAQLRELSLGTAAGTAAGTASGNATTAAELPPHLCCLGFGEGELEALRLPF